MFLAVPYCALVIVLVAIAVTYRMGIWSFSQCRVWRKEELRKSTRYLVLDRLKNNENILVICPELQSSAQFLFQLPDSGPFSPNLYLLEIGDGFEIGTGSDEWFVEWKRYPANGSTEPARPMEPMEPIPPNSPIFDDDEDEQTRRAFDER